MMKRLQIYIDEQQDAALAVEAARRKTSKAALIRECVAERLAIAAPKDGEDNDIVGWIEDELPDSSAVDDVVYGRAVR
jgi:hypothetical protein